MSEHAQSGTPSPTVSSEVVIDPTHNAQGEPGLMEWMEHQLAEGANFSPEAIDSEAEDAILESEGDLGNQPKEVPPPAPAAAAAADPPLSCPRNSNFKSCLLAKLDK